MSNPQISYDLNYCPGCGARITAPFRLLLTFLDVDGGHFVAYDRDFAEDPPQSVFVKLLCEACHERSKLLVPAFMAHYLPQYGLLRLLGGLLDEETTTH